MNATHEETIGGGVSCRYGRKMRGWRTTTDLRCVTCKTCRRKIENRRSALVARRVEKFLDARILVLHACRRAAVARAASAGDDEAIAAAVQQAPRLRAVKGGRS